MNKKQKFLITQMSLFFFIVVLLLGLIIIKEQKPKLMLNKVDKKMQEYINNNYDDIKDEIELGKTSYQNNKYTQKITNKQNENLYFIITYQNKKITTTYKKDYEEGYTLAKEIEKNLNKTLEEKTKISKPPVDKISISFNTKLNNCTTLIKKRLIAGKYDLPLYTVNVEKMINYTEEDLNNELLLLDNYISELGLNPKEYNLKYTDQKNITNTIDITLKSDIISTDSLTISNAIITNNKTMLEKYNIVVKQLN